MRDPARVGLATLLACTAAAITTEILPVGLLPSISREFGVPASVSGLLVSVYALLVAVLALPLTRLTERFPRKGLLLTTIGGYAASNAMVAFGPDFDWVAGGRALGGVAHALFFSVSSAYATALVPPERQGRAIAFVAGGASVGYVAGVPLSTTIGTLFGWRASFAAVGVLALVLLVIASIALPPADPRSTGHAVQGGARNPLRVLVVVGVANALGFLGQHTLYTYIAPLLIGAGVPEPAVGGTLFLLALAGLGGVATAGFWIDRRPRALLVLGLAGAAAGVALTVLLRHSLAGALIGAIVWLLAFGVVPSCFTAASIRTRAVSADLAAAVNNATSNIGIASGAFVGGLLVAGPGFGVAGAVSAGAFALTAVLVALARRGFPDPAHAPHAA